MRASPSPSAATRRRATAWCSPRAREAKAFGVKTGDVIWEAQRKCPDLIIRPVRFSEYVKQSRAVRGIYARYTDLIEPFGIDECWLT